MLGGAGRFSAAASGAHTALAGVPLRVVLLVVSNVLAEGPGFRALVIVDDFTRGYLALVVDTSSSVRRVARELDAIVMAGGKPLMIVSDNGTEFTSYAILRWQEERGFGWHYFARPESRCSTLSSRASTGASTTSALTSTCSVACRWHGRPLKPGGSITVPAGRTPA
jgi:Integrase core domain